MVASHLVAANLAGHDSHGVMRIIQYAEMIRAGQIIPGARSICRIPSGIPSSWIIRGSWKRCKRSSTRPGRRESWWEWACLPTNSLPRLPLAWECSGSSAVMTLSTWPKASRSCIRKFATCPRPDQMLTPSAAAPVASLQRPGRSLGWIACCPGWR